VKLAELMDLAELNRLVAENYITARDHARLPYKILNYTPKTQFAGHWTKETELSRGLAYDTRDGTIVARSFRKFFNWGEREVVIPDEPFVAYEKLDGCFTFGTPLNLWAAAPSRSEMSSRSASVRP
jgi:RNA ligase